MDGIVDMKQVVQVPKKLAFLDLHPELRNKIYKLVLVDDQPLIVNLREELLQSTPALWQLAAPHHRYDTPRIKEDDRDIHRLAITATCKQIHEESFSIFLSNNTFMIKLGDQIPATDDQRLLRNFSRVRCLRLRGWLSYLGDFKTYLRRLDVDLGLLRHDFDPSFWCGIWVRSRSGRRIAAAEVTPPRTELPSMKFG
ncbi:hypothetical protein DOTSEDRAFT_21690 [Dothistroma septosporum NZE10]|uniref:Uncharacterized protein n=1 Tax=Dothistroma septosporum (strain NZE10 / CBS 128990) TaxID=675120 RepID=N1PX25_DOTSN|nr:hypothetical protein DOTSEDRAFT_21690 [Dothistroma septosporum NZE10]